MAEWSINEVKGNMMTVLSMMHERWQQAKGWLTAGSGAEGIHRESRLTQWQFL